MEGPAAPVGYSFARRDATGGPSRMPRDDASVTRTSCYRGRRPLPPACHGNGLSARYAIYYAPDRSSDLWHFGSRVLGYDAWSGETLPALVPDGFSPADWHVRTADPRLYGFHATLKAPFRLAAGRSEAELLAAASSFAAAQGPVRLAAGLNIVATPSASRAGSAFIALREGEPSAALQALEQACVRAFEPLRAPVSDEDRARRPADGMTARQAAQFEAFGYPYIFEDFRFHMTLSSRLDGPEVETARASLDALFKAQVTQGPQALDRICVFRQPEAGARFAILSEHLFRGS